MGTLTASIDSEMQRDTQEVLSPFHSLLSLRKMLFGFLLLLFHPLFFPLNIVGLHADGSLVRHITLLSLQRLTSLLLYLYVEEQEK